MQVKKKALKGSLLLVLLVMALALVMPTSAQAASNAKLNKTKATVYVAKTVKLKVKNTSKKVRWSSSNKAVAKVNQKGVVTGKKKGKATITAKVGSKKLKCRVTVKSNYWKSKYINNLSQPYAWNGVSYISGDSYIKTQPVKLKYNSKGNLVATIAVLNESPFYSYHCSAINVAITNYKTGAVIATGTFSFNRTVLPNHYLQDKIIFNKNTTKKQVKLRGKNKTDFKCNIIVYN